MALNEYGGHALFAQDASAVSEARTWVVAYFRAQGYADLAESARLAVSELMTNALREPALFEADGDKLVAVKIVRDRDVHRVEVYDGNPEPPPAESFLPDEEDSLTGRGLLLVDAYVNQRGWTKYCEPATGKASGKCVWFTLARPEEDSPEGP